MKFNIYKFRTIKNKEIEITTSEKLINHSKTKIAVKVGTAKGSAY